MKAKKIISLLLAVLLLLGTVSISALADDTEQTEETPLYDATSVFDSIYSYYPADTVVLTVNGTEVTWDMYAYWLINSLYSGLSYYIYYLGGLPGDIAQYDEELKDQTNHQIAYFIASETEAKAEGIELSAEDEAMIEQNLEDMKESYGGEEALAEALKQSYITRDIYQQIMRYSQYMNNVHDAHFGAENELLPEEDILAWAKDNEYVHIEHILYATEKAAADAELTEEQVKKNEEKKARAEEVLAELQAITEPEELQTRFEEIMNSESDDAGALAQFPHGYTYKLGIMDPAFDAAAETLSEGELSGLVSGSYGYHILLALPLNGEDMTMDQNSATGATLTLREAAASDLFSEEVIGWIEKAEIVPGDKLSEATLADMMAKATLVDPDAVSEGVQDVAEQVADQFPDQIPEKSEKKTGVLIVVLIVAVVALATALIIVSTKKKPETAAETVTEEAESIEENTENAESVTEETETAEAETEEAETAAESKPDAEENNTVDPELFKTEE